MMLSALVSPQQILGRIDASNRGGMILRRLCAYHPSPVSRAMLMEGAGIRPNVEGPVCAAASLAWWICRINDDLERLGWSATCTRDGVCGLVRVPPT